MARKELLNSNIETDMETGEVSVIETVKRSSGQTIVVLDNKKKKEKYQPNEQKFIKIGTASEQKKMMLSLGRRERAFLYPLLFFMDWETNLLVGDGEIGKKGKPLTWANTDKLTGFDRHTRKLIVESLEKNKVIGYIVVGGAKRGIVINPKFALRGKIPKEALKEAFDCDYDVDYEED